MNLFTLWILVICSCLKLTISNSVLPNPLTSYDKSSYFVDKIKYVANPIDFRIEISESDLNKSVSFGNSVVDRMHRLETNLGWSNINVKKGSPAHSQLIESKPEIEALEQGKHALVAAKATVHLINLHCYKHHLSATQCAKYMTGLKLRSTQLKSSCSTFERSCSLSERESKYRKFDGSCNHVTDATIGRSFTSYKRLLFPDYLDGVQELRRSSNRKFTLPSPRLISTNMVRSNDLEDKDLTLAVMQWGQFIAHDMAHTASSKMIHSGNTIECCTPAGMKLSPRYVHPFCAPITVPVNDKFYSKHNLQCMNYVRSVPAIRPDCSLGPIEQLNQATHFLDGSQIYGNHITNTYKLRTFTLGQLDMDVISKKSYLHTYQNISLAGDSRVNSQPQLTAMHTIWAREHNRIALELSQSNPNWDEDKLFQETRRIVIAEIQHITYTEWLGRILGKTYIKKISTFGSFNEAVDPSVSNSFATAAMRFVKSLMPGDLRLYSENRTVMDVIKLKDHFYKNINLQEPDILDGLLRGLTTQRAQKADLDYAQDVTNLLYGNGKTGLDVISLDIQRGRDHGLPSYTAYRTLCGLPAVHSFEDFSDVMPAKTAQKLSEVYKHPNDVDLLVGGMSEESKDDSLLGPTFSCILSDQFLRTRVGDRYFYSFLKQPTSFTNEQYKQIKSTTLARVLCDNGDDIKSLQFNVFLPVSQTNALQSCSSLPRLNLDAWKED